MRVLPTLVFDSTVTSFVPFQKFTETSVNSSKCFAGISANISFIFFGAFIVFNLSQCSNIKTIFGLPPSPSIEAAVRLDVSNEDISSEVSLAQPQNIFLISVTFSVLKLDRSSEVNDVQL